MAKDRLSGKLAVILHADVAGSTQLVQQDEQLAHERIQSRFRSFGDIITKYHGHVRELRGDALMRMWGLRKGENVIAQRKRKLKSFSRLILRPSRMKPDGG